MKQVVTFILTLLFPILGHGEQARFSDPITGLSLKIPSEFRFDESESQTDPSDTLFWYVFLDADQNMITIEIEEYDHYKTLPEFFHHALTDEEEDTEGNEKFIFEGLEFKNLMINGREFTKCKLRAHAIESGILEPLYICDYLCVKDNYGISIGLLKRDDGNIHRKELEKLMENVLTSLKFE